MYRLVPNSVGNCNNPQRSQRESAPSHLKVHTQIDQIDVPNNRQGSQRESAPWPDLLARDGGHCHITKISSTLSGSPTHSMKWLSSQSENLSKHHPLTRKLCESTNTESSFPECSPNFSQVLEVNYDKSCCNISIIQHFNVPHEYTWGCSCNISIMLQCTRLIIHTTRTSHVAQTNSGNLLFHPIIVTLYGLVVIYCACFPQ